MKKMTKTIGGVSIRGVQVTAYNRVTGEIFIASPKYEEEFRGCSERTVFSWPAKEETVQRVRRQVTRSVEKLAEISGSFDDIDVGFTWFGDENAKTPEEVVSPALGDAMIKLWRI
jgi:hypothetical protein